MHTLGRWLDWLLPGLICLCPMGAMAYYNASADTEVAQPDSERAGRRSLVSNSVMGAAIGPFARL